MADEADNLAEAPKAKKFERVASTIAFPYSDIDDAIAVAEGLLKGGGQPLTRDQLAAAMGQSPTSGAFNTKTSTARTFGVIESVSGKYQLTDLGFDIADANRRKEAMVRAFLNVELFKRTYDEFRGKRLPPRPHGLENAFISFGVSKKQAQTARLYFDRSARKAGFFPGGDEDRLVEPFGFQNSAQEPNNGAVERPLEPQSRAVLDEPDRNAPAAAFGIHKSILGMLDELPVPKSAWAKADQADWLEAMATLFQVIYKSEGGGEIEVSFKPTKA